MARKKRKRSNVPKRKRFNRQQRLQSAKSWLSTYDGGNVARAYRKRYGVDWIAAFIELEMLGVKIDARYKKEVLRSMRGQSEAKRRKRMEKAAELERSLEDYQDENFAYIVGYTNWGFPYGVTWEEWEEFESEGADSYQITDADLD